MKLRRHPAEAENYAVCYFGIIEAIATAVAAAAPEEAAAAAAADAAASGIAAGAGASAAADAAFAGIAGATAADVAGLGAAGAIFGEAGTSFAGADAAGAGLFGAGGAAGGGLDAAATFGEAGTSFAGATPAVGNLAIPGASTVGNAILSQAAGGLAGDVTGNPDVGMAVSLGTGLSNPFGNLGTGVSGGTQITGADITGMGPGTAVPPTGVGGAAAGALGGSTLGTDVTGPPGGGVSGGATALAQTPGAVAIGTGADTGFTGGGAQIINPADIPPGQPGSNVLPDGTPLTDVGQPTGPGFFGRMGQSLGLTSPGPTNALTPEQFAQQVGPAQASEIETALNTPGGVEAGGAMPGGVAGTGGSSLSKLISDPSVGSLSNFVGNNAGTLLGAGVLGFEALNKPKPPAGLNSTGLTRTLGTQANTLATQGNQLTAPLTTGQLPPGAEAQVQQAVQSAKATARSQFAAMGMSGSTEEATTLANIDASAVGQRFQIAQALATTGINEIGLSNQVYTNLLNQTLAQDQAFADALAKFAGSVAGGGQSIKLSLT